MSTWHTLVEAPALAARLGAPSLVVFDCRHDLAKPGYGRDAFASGRIPYARFLHLDDDLSGPKTGRNGRHPLPSAEDFVALMRSHGVSETTQVVAYDDAGGMYAARLWWMLRWVGHEAVAVLDGGLPAARAAGLGETTAVPAVPALPPYPVSSWRLPSVGLEEVERLVKDPAWKVLDVRSRERWRGEVEPIDPVPGRIPGTVNLPFAANLGPDGRFKPAATLRAEYLALLAGVPPEHLVVHCGSGVTACHTLLALELAGLDGAALYVGSYGEWCRRGKPLGKG
ncbi:MAG TPA: sulfurtransferase [Anaeromyxobacteraceae bacterium]|nr:sulfurtransferase [Anaeromyxobacteraceae bacterium]